MYLLLVGSKCIFDHDFPMDSNTILIMGSEKFGVPPEIADTLPGLNVSCVYLPMSERIRSYNVANAASMALNEFERQCYAKNKVLNL